MFTLIPLVIDHFLSHLPLPEDKHDSIWSGASSVSFFLNAGASFMRLISQYFPHLCYLPFIVMCLPRMNSRPDSLYLPVWTTTVRTLDSRRFPPEAGSTVEDQKGQTIPGSGHWSDYICEDFKPFKDKIARPEWRWKKIQPAYLLDLSLSGWYFSVCTNSFHSAGGQGLRGKRFSKSWRRKTSQSSQFSSEHWCHCQIWIHPSKLL